MATVYSPITPPLKNTAYTFYIALDSQAQANTFQTSVTLAVGDIKVSGDGGGFNNITANPPAVEIGTTGVLAVALTAAEMNYNQCVMILFRDAAGAQWKDCLVMIELKQAVTVSDLTQAQVLSDATPFPGARIDAAISSRLATSGYTAPPTAAAISDAISEEITADHSGVAGSNAANWAAAAVASGGSGSIAWPFTINDGATPIDGALVQVATDVGISNVVASGYTDALGAVTLNLDAGTYYVRVQAAGYNFSDSTVVVA